MGDRGIRCGRLITKHWETVEGCQPSDHVVKMDKLIRLLANRMNW